ncbi:MAG: hypothetical protein M9933_02770 [Chitinophagaceae bacterium]|nr:hypothetical protein [Chitinophagaceae bacterium]
MSKRKTELFQYVLILRKEHPAPVDGISFLLCFISWIFALYLSLIGDTLHSALFWISWLIPAALIRTIRTKRRRNKSQTYRDPLFITGVVWLFIPGLRWAALLFMVFILFDHQSRRPLEIGISDERVVVNTFFRKYYDWKQLANVVLKDGLLTLDFKNNRIIQREIMQQEINVEEFNSFCKEQLS